MPTPGTEVRSKGRNQWLIRARRELAGKSATGDVLVKQVEKPSATDATHVMLAGSSAWLALGEKLFAAHDDKGALICARRGVDELGKKYAPPYVEDDTSLSLLLAEEYAEQGKHRDAAEMTLQTLRVRIDLYKELHRATIEG